MKLDDLRKLELGSQPPGNALDDDAEVSAIVKVREAHYVPAGLTLRSRIDDKIFTATCRAAALRDLDRDPLVESVALTQKLRSLA